MIKIVVSIDWLIYYYTLASRYTDSAIPANLEPYLQALFLSIRALW